MTCEDDGYLSPLCPAIHAETTSSGNPDNVFMMLKQITIQLIMGKVGSFM